MPWLTCQTRPENVGWRLTAWDRCLCEALTSQHILARDNLARGIEKARNPHLKIFQGEFGPRIIHLIERDVPVEGCPAAVTAIGAGENVVTARKRDCD